MTLLAFAGGIIVGVLLTGGFFWYLIRGME